MLGSSYPGARFVCVDDMQPINRQEIFCERIGGALIFLNLCRERTGEI